MEFNEIMNNVRKKLDLHMVSAMPCKLRKTSGNASLMAANDPQERKLAMNTCKERLLAKTSTQRKRKLPTHVYARLMSLPDHAFKRLRAKIMKIISLKRVQFYESLQSCAQTYSDALSNGKSGSEGRS